MARVSSRSLIASLLLALFMPALAACGGTALPAPAITTPQPAGTAVVASVIPPAPEPTATEPVPTPTPTPEPTSSPEPTPEPTAVPELGQTNDANQWWDGAGWQVLPEGEGWQLSLAEDGTVKAVDASGTEYTWESGGWKLSATPTPEIQLAEGEALYTYNAPTGEVVRVALDVEVAEIVGLAIAESGQQYMDQIDFSQIRLTGDTGGRSLMVGPIQVANENEDGSWEKNEDVYIIPGYLGFKRAMAWEVDLGSVDPGSIEQGNAIIYSGDVIVADGGMGSFQLVSLDFPTIVGASKTYLVIDQANSPPVSSAILKIEFAYRETVDSSPITFGVTAHHDIMVNSKIQPVLDWNPDIGYQVQWVTMGYLLNGTSASVESRRNWAEDNLLRWRYDNVTEQIASSGINFSGWLDANRYVISNLRTN